MAASHPVAVVCLQLLVEGEGILDGPPTEPAQPLARVARQGGDLHHQLTLITVPRLLENTLANIFSHVYKYFYRVVVVLGDGPRLGQVLPVQRVD